MADDAQLDKEIAAIRSQIRLLTHRRSSLLHQSTATASASSSHQNLLTHLTSNNSEHTLAASPTDPIAEPSPFLPSTFSRSRKQARHSQECLYRMGAGATMFEVKDPDPHAVDNGRVFGVRIEVFTDGKFHHPYYIFLTRNPTKPPTLRLHRHTLPPHIPLTSFLATHLPQPQPTTPHKSPPVQSLPHLIRALRRHLTSYHLRLSAIASLRASLGLIPVAGGKQRASTHKIRALEMTDVEGRDVRVVWTDGRVGRVRVGIAGVVEKCVVMGEEGRERAVERVLMGGDQRIEGLGERLRKT